MHHVTVGAFQTTEIVTLVGTLETAADGVTDHVDKLASFEQGKSGMFGWKFCSCFEAEFKNATLGSRASFFEAGQIRLVDAEFLLVIESDLNRGVALLYC